MAYASGVKVEKDVANVELVLSPGAVVNGSIVDKNGQAVAGAKVSYLSGNLVFTAVTGSDGTYTIVVPKDKKYTVLAVDPAKPDSEPAELARYLSIGNLGKYQVDSLEAPFGAEPAAAGGSGKGRSSSNMPEITALTVDVTEGTPVLTLNAWGRSTVDFSALPGTTLITGGSVTVNRACEIALTSQTDKFPFGLSTTQELVEGVNNLDIISYLGVLDAGQDGVSLKKLKEVFGAAVDFYATLTDNNGRTAYVTLGLILP
ncbi:MAG: hypothetical protein BWY80_00854 [Firmicutes bacterium ADurb.Bin456]|nr:MAG: hypothetical protein BWY80_00854 [Firmicutes bacterium ADurb.Bin456]